MFMPTNLNQNLIQACIEDLILLVTIYPFMTVGDGWDLTLRLTFTMNLEKKWIKDLSKK